MNSLVRTISGHEHHHERDSKRNFKKKDKREQPSEIEQTAQTHDPHKLPKYNQDDGAMLANLGLEICPYMRNILVDREKLLFYGSCALPEDYVPGKDISTCKPGGSFCPRHRADPIGQPGCWHYNLSWGKREYKPEEDS